MDPSRGDSRYNLNYSMSSIGLSLADQTDLYGNPGLGAVRPPSSGGLIQSMGGRQSATSAGGGGGGSAGLMGHGGGGSSGSTGGGQCQSQQSLGGGSGQSRGIKRSSSDCYDDHHRGSGGMTSQTLQGLESCGGGNGGGGQQSAGNVPDVVDDSYTSMQNKKSPPANGKKTKGRVKIKMEYIDNKLRRYTTFSKRKTGIMKKAYELSTLTGTQVMLLVASETGHVYTFATRKLQPMITSEAGKQLIQTCLNSPDPPSGGTGGGDQRMSATGFEETELSYNIADEDSKDDRSPLSSINESDDSSDIDSPGPSSLNNSQAMLTDSPILEHTNNFRQQQQQQQQQQHQAHQAGGGQSSSSNSSSHYDDLKPPTLAQLGAGMNNVLYPASALANIPQEVLLGLVQSGHLQLHAEEDGSGHQFLTIPFSMSGSGSNNGGGGGGGSVGNNSSSSSSLISGGSSISRGGGGGGGGNVGNGPSSSTRGNNNKNSNRNNSNNISSNSNSSKIHVKDFSNKTGATTRTTSSSSSPSSSSSIAIANGRESPPKEGIIIKKEIID